MPLPRLRLPLSLLAVWFAVLSTATAHDPAQDKLAEEMATAASAFLAGLNDEDRATATLSFDDQERENFHYVPMVRRGLVLKSMKAAQRGLALRLLHTALSPEGSLKALAIIQLENVLRELENNPVRRDPELYYVAIFGEPGKLPWGWRFEGHHLSVNQTITAHGISGTPLFFGTNPARVPHGPQEGQRILGEEEDSGRAFLLSLTPRQRESAIVAAVAASEIETAQHSRVDPLDPVGLHYRDMTPAQQQTLRAIVQLYLDRHEHEIAAAALARIEEHGLENLVFAWAGPAEPGEGHYYRIQGPTFVIEYANTQNNANHHHTVFRDFENDFGRDLFGDHYRHDH